MSRLSFIVLFVAAASLTSSRARAELPVAPPPREVRPDGARDPVPTAKAEDPAVTVKRIIDNSKEVGEKLAKTDTSTDTRNTQGKILSDIDALINQQENPPPPNPDQNKDKEKDPKGMSDMKDPMMKDGMPMSKDGMPMGMSDPQPMGGMGERKPRMGDPMNDTKKDPGGNAKDPGKPDEKKGTPKDPKEPGTTGGNPMGKVGPGGKASLPPEEDVWKDVWGHLPDKLRQQMSQYYKDDFTPKYAELLRLYYSSLSDKGAKPEKK